MGAGSFTESIPDWVLRAGVVATLFAFWLALSELGGLDESLFASPGAVLSVLWEWLTTGSIYPDVWATLRAVGLGLVVGTTIGVAVGVVFAYTPLLAGVFAPLLVGINAVPLAALAPIFVLWFGLGLLPKVVFATVLIFFQTFLRTYNGLLGIDGALVDNTRLLGAGRWGMFRSVYSPAIGLSLLGTLRISIGFAFLGVVVGEYLGSTQGLGKVLSTAQHTLALDSLVAGLAVLLALVGAFTLPLGPLERRVTRWRLF